MKGYKGKKMNHSKIYFVLTSYITALAVLLIISGMAQATVINIDATKYGFASPTDPAPVPGQTITPITNPGSLPLNQLTLGAGIYTVSNATGVSGADPSFTGWRFNGGDNWVWNFVIADDATHKVVFYADAGGVQSTQAGIASQLSVQNFSSTFTLPTGMTLDFMIRDYYLPDNAGGVALRIESANPVPEPATLLLLGSGLAGIVVWRKRLG